MARAKKTNNNATTTTEKPKSTLAVMEPLTRENRNLEEVIRVRAYQLFEERGRSHGHHQEDWLRAEQEVLRQAGGRRSA